MSTGRGEVRSLCNAMVPTHFGFNTGKSRGEIVEIIKTLKTRNNYTYKDYELVSQIRDFILES